jgi:hypothetical protein
LHCELSLRQPWFCVPLGPIYSPVTGPSSCARESPYPPRETMAGHERREYDIGSRSSIVFDSILMGMRVAYPGPSTLRRRRPLAGGMSDSGPSRPSGDGRTTSLGIGGGGPFRASQEACVRDGSEAATSTITEWEGRICNEGGRDWANECTRRAREANESEGRRGSGREKRAGGWCAVCDPEQTAGKSC